MSKNRKIPFSVAGQLRQAINRFKSPQTMGDITRWMGLAAKLDKIIHEWEAKRELALASVGVLPGETVTQADARYKAALEAMQRVDVAESDADANEIAIYAEAELWREVEENFPIAEAALVAQWLKKED